jgi:hypothetical protein
MNKKIEFKKLDEVLDHVTMTLMHTVEIEGEIDKIIPFGNSVIIKFKNGNSYKQPLVGKETSKATLDIL